MIHSGVRRSAWGKERRSWLWLVGLEVRRLLTVLADQARRGQFGPGGVHGQREARRSA